jgi:SAM-dependent methyltransferase
MSDAGGIFIVAAQEVLQRIERIAFPHKVHDCNLGIFVHVSPSFIFMMQSACFLRAFPITSAESIECVMTVIGSELASTTASPQFCPQCGGLSKLFRIATDVNRKTTSELFAYHRCASCGLVFLANIPADMAQHYQHGYQPVPRTLAELRSRSGREKFRLNKLLEFKSAGKLLEIGPWIGIFTINALDAGFEVEAIENDESCVDFLRDTVGIKVFGSKDPASILSGMSERYDVIALWHSLEHLPTPWLVIQNAAKALKPNGLLLVAIPNIDSYDSRVMRENWLHLDAPRHLYFYSPDGLSAICKKSDLILFDMCSSDRLSVNLSLQAWYHYLRRCSPFKYLGDIAGLASMLVAPNRTSESQVRFGSGLTAMFGKGEKVVR